MKLVDRLPLLLLKLQHRPFSWMLHGWYFFGIKALLRVLRRAERRTGHSAVKAVYLTHEAGRGAIVPGATQLKFFLILETLPSEEEMEFLKEFWASQRKLKKYFPFLGETLMADENELENWFDTPTLRAYSARLSWRLLDGTDLLAKYGCPEFPPDLFPEALKIYWRMLRAFTVHSAAFSARTLTLWESGFLLRELAKGYLDLCRMLESLKASNKNSLESYWRSTRKELLELLATESDGVEKHTLANALFLRNIPHPSRDLLPIFSTHLHAAMEKLSEIEKLSQAPAAGPWTLKYHQNETQREPYGYSVRELFSERLLLRHEATVEKMIVSKQTTQMFAIFSNIPARSELSEFLTDLRDANLAFDRNSVCMPLTGQMYNSFAARPKLRLPFFSQYRHSDISLDASKDIQVTNHEMPAPILDSHALRREFLELSFYLRQLTMDINGLVENYLGPVMSFRLALSSTELLGDPMKAFSAFEKRFPLRCRYVKQTFGPMLEGDISDLNEKIEGKFFQSQPISDEFRRLLESENLPSDLWVNATPFMRREINVLKDRLFRIKPKLKI